MREGTIEGAGGSGARLGGGVNWLRSTLSNRTGLKNICARVTGVYVFWLDLVYYVLRVRFLLGTETRGAPHHAASQAPLPFALARKDADG